MKSAAKEAVPQMIEQHSVVHDSPEEWRSCASPSIQEQTRSTSLSGLVEAAERYNPCFLKPTIDYLKKIVEARSLPLASGKNLRHPLLSQQQQSYRQMKGKRRIVINVSA